MVQCQCQCKILLHCICFVCWSTYAVAHQLAMADPQSELRNVQFWVSFWVSFVICQNVHIKFVSVYQETTKKERKQKKNII